MKSELKYGIHASLLVFVLFVAIRIISVIDFKPQKTESATTVSEKTIHNEVPVKNVRGKELFKANCASCHAIHKNLTGPALAGIEERVPDKELLYRWIRNNQEVLKSGEPYFNLLFKDYNKTSMNVFPNLTDYDIKDILEYIKEDQEHSSAVMPGVAI
ncbi:MAG TPA: cytochrome c [Chitinophagaceae bacterium]|nr:cytochrome c [Chitinophagaceae bacterium]